MHKHASILLILQKKSTNLPFCVTQTGPASSKIKKGENVVFVSPPLGWLHDSNLSHLLQGLPSPMLSSCSWRITHSPPPMEALSRLDSSFYIFIASLSFISTKLTCSFPLPGEPEGHCRTSDSPVMGLEWNPGYFFQLPPCSHFPLVLLLTSSS